MVELSDVEHFQHVMALTKLSSDLLGFLFCGHSDFIPITIQTKSSGLK